MAENVCICFILNYLRQILTTVSDNWDGWPEGSIPFASSVDDFFGPSDLVTGFVSIACTGVNPALTIPCTWNVNIYILYIKITLLVSSGVGLTLSRNAHIMV